MINLDNIILDQYKTLILSNGIHHVVSEGDIFEYRLLGDSHSRRMKVIAIEFTQGPARIVKVNVRKSKPDGTNWPYTHAFRTINDHIETGHWEYFALAQTEFPSTLGAHDRFR